MSDWKIIQGKKLSNGKIRPMVSRIQDGKTIKKRLSQLVAENQDEARDLAYRWIIKEEQKTDASFIADDTITIGGFIENFYDEWRISKFAASDPSYFYRLLKENNLWDTKLIDITPKWSRKFRSLINDFKRLDGKPYAEGVYAVINADMNHLLERAIDMDLVTTNVHFGGKNPNGWDYSSEEDKAAKRANNKKLQSWTQEQLAKYLPLFASIPSTRVHTAKKASHLEDKKANIMKADQSESWKVYWTNEDGDYRSKQFNWKKNGGRERAMIKAQAFADGITKTLVSEDICVVEKGQFDGIDTEMWFGVFNIGLGLGLRIGEIAGLKFSDFTDDFSEVHIQRMVVRRRGAIVIEDRPKSGSWRTMGVPKTIQAVVQTLKQYHELNGTIDNDYLFQYRLGGIIRVNYWQTQFRRVQTLVGIPNKEQLTSTHCMRHTHISVIAKAGVPMPMIQKRAGHKKMATTAEYYVHIVDDKEATDTFDDIVVNVEEDKTKRLNL